uniref:HSF-type DNA-binding domain-containing protein n=1 Tax=Mucochytrium quahogii TaxID=96639 RepID=A0A7S2W9J3_9STRA|mmetsp:Transcript_27718/g.44349  ORF Transcript_27718/g.44349 Transcript_27718/m.44349 type:complete len:461 (+) Transcript_27718:211-1593(+)
MPVSRKNDSKTQKQKAIEVQRVKQEPVQQDALARANPQQRIMVTKFLKKTFQLVENPENHEYVDWSPDGKVVVIKKLHGFCEKVLPKYFKHSNFASFVRQLNMYGFNRMPKMQNAFQHPLFLRGKEENLALIKRKVAATKEETAIVQSPAELDSVLGEVQRLKSKQKNIDDQMLKLRGENAHLCAENELLWNAFNEGKERQRVLAEKMKQILQFLYKTFVEGGNNALEAQSVFHEHLPKIMDQARAAGVEIEPISKGSTGESSSNSLVKQDNHSLTARQQSLLSPTTESDGLSSDLKRMDTISTLPTLDLMGPSLSIMGGGGGGDLTNTLNQLRAGTAPTDDSVDAPADSVVRSESLQSFMDVMESPQENHFGKLTDLAKDVNQYITDQDDTMRRLESISSTLSDPIGPWDEQGLAVPLDRPGSTSESDSAEKPSKGAEAKKRTSPDKAESGKAKKAKTK